MARDRKKIPVRQESDRWVVAPLAHWGSGVPPVGSGVEYGSCFESPSACAGTTHHQ
jgi:hypothetical protein